MTDDRSVLVVDDDDAIRTLISRVLLRADFDVAQAGNGSEALAKLRARRFQTVVLDLMMPVMSGFELVEYLRDQRRRRRTLHRGRLRRRRARPAIDHLAAGDAACCAKPFDLPELLAAVEKCASDQWRCSRQ